MFTQYFTKQSLVLSHKGVDLSNYECHKLEASPIYSNYKKQDLHYPIGAIQKGLKPHTQKGLKRLKQKNNKKIIKQKQQKNAVPLLNPKCPQVICMKALRTQFRNKLQETYIQGQKTQLFSSIRSRVSRRRRAPIIKLARKNPKIQKRKVYQKKRRAQLINLLKKYKNLLIPHFGDRLKGFKLSVCPQVSRKQIKDYLLTKGIVVESQLQKQTVQQRYEPIDKTNRQINKTQKITPYEIKSNIDSYNKYNTILKFHSPNPFEINTDDAQSRKQPYTIQFIMNEELQPLKLHIPWSLWSKYRYDPFKDQHLCDPEKSLKQILQYRDLYTKLHTTQSRKLLYPYVCYVLIKKMRVSPTDSLRLGQQILKYPIQQILDCLADCELIKIKISNFKFGENLTKLDNQNITTNIC